jgi:AcrR family transcriptional regulator
MMEVVAQKHDRYKARSQKTIARLLEAAEEVFVRDGFELAQMDKIAARAQRSKGAVYVHFKSKEDMFLALMEHRIKTYVDRFTDQMASRATKRKRLAAFRDFYEGLVHDRAYHVLTLEFKLFALRHPAWKDRYRKALLALNNSYGQAEFEQMLGQNPDLYVSVLALGPIANSLVLESYFEPGSLSEKTLRRLLLRIFDALFQAA